MASDGRAYPFSETRPVTRGACTSGLLAAPLRPSFDRTCPACRKRFALRFQQASPHPVVGEVKTYRCRACGHEVGFAQGRPVRTV